MEPLNDHELDLYARQIILPDIGGLGQTRLKNTHIAVIGAGGIGCPALLYLASGGIGRISIFDDDAVSLSNLHRQTLFSPHDIDRPKAECAAEKLHILAPNCKVTAHHHKFTAQHVFADADRPDLLIDGTDNFASRLSINDWAVANRVPLVSAAIGRFQGQVGVFQGHLPDAPCYRCFVGDAFDSDDCDNCAEMGVLGAMVGMVGTMAALEAMRFITGFGNNQKGKLQLIDGLKPSMRGINLFKDGECSTCGHLKNMDDIEG